MAGTQHGNVGARSSGAPGLLNAQGCATRPPQGADRLDADIRQLLGCRYGDGLVYLRDASQHAAYHRALSLGLVSADGYLTAAGCSAAAVCDLD